MNEPCAKGDKCKKFCMADLSMKLHNIIWKFKCASKGGSYGKMESVKQKLDEFESTRSRETLNEVLI